MFLVRHLLLISYLLILCYIVFIAGNAYRSTSYLQTFGDVNFIPFKDKLQYIKYDARVDNNTTFILKEITGNLLLLFPFPLILIFFYGAISRKKVIAVSFFLSCLIESIQTFTGLGNADIDDVILNTIGAIGGGLFSFWLKKHRYWPSIQRFLRLP